MKFAQQLTDEVVLRELGARLTSARLERNMTQAKLAWQAGVSKRTVERLESGAVATQLSGFVRVCRALGLLDRFDVLLPELGPAPMTQLKLQGRRRQRASGRHSSVPAAKKWTWGEKA